MMFLRVLCVNIRSSSLLLVIPSIVLCHRLFIRDLIDGSQLSLVFPPVTNSMSLGVEFLDEAVSVTHQPCSLKGLCRCALHLRRVTGAASLLHLHQHLVVLAAHLSRGKWCFSGDLISHFPIISHWVFCERSMVLPVFPTLDCFSS